MSNDKDGKIIAGTGSPDFSVLWGGSSAPICKHEQVTPRIEGQHDNIGGNCAICKSPLSKAFVKMVEGKLVYEVPEYVKPAGKSRKRGITPL